MRDIDVSKGGEELDIKEAAIKELATTELNIQTYDQIEMPPAATTGEATDANGFESLGFKVEDSHDIVVSK